MLIDCHAHAFADKIAEKAVCQLVDYYSLPTTFGGRLEDLLAVASGAGLDAVVLLIAATRGEQVGPANDWIIELAQDRPGSSDKSPMRRTPKIIPFGAYHPDCPNWLEEIQRLRNAGIKGIKLHPEFQGIDLADPRLRDLFAEVQRDFTLMVHVGDRETCHTNLSTPHKLAAILNDFPGLKVIAAHMGGYLFWEEVLHSLAGRDVYLDTSSTFPFIDPELLRRIISKHGTDRILFGSDYPLRSPQQDLPLLDAISWMSDDAKESIKGKNCAHLLGIDS
jgi:uncharacterized protein